MADLKREEFSSSAEILEALKASLSQNSISGSQKIIAQAIDNSATKQGAFILVKERQEVEEFLKSIASKPSGLPTAVAGFLAPLGSGIVRVLGPRVQGFIGGLTLVLAGWLGIGFFTNNTTEKKTDLGQKTGQEGNLQSGDDKKTPGSDDRDAADHRLTGVETATKSATAAVDKLSADFKVLKNELLNEILKPDKAPEIVKKIIDGTVKPIPPNVLAELQKLPLEMRKDLEKMEYLKIANGTLVK